MTNNISRRLEEHQMGLNQTCFSFKRRPVELLFYQEFNDVEQAIYFDKKIKNWGAKKICSGKLRLRSIKVASAM